MRDDDPHHNGARALWQAVLMLAVEDAVLGVDGPGADGRNPEERRRSRLRMTIKARTYLTQPSEDLATLCHLAGLDPVAVMDAMRKRIAQAPSPEELASTRKASPASIVPKPKVGSKRPRRPTHHTLDGETLHFDQWAARLGISPQTLYHRLYILRWPLRDALTRPKNDGHGAAFRKGKLKAPSTSRGSMPDDADDTSTTSTATSTRSKNAAQLYSHEGETMTLSQWAKRIGVRKNSLSVRLARGWSFEQAITTPFAKPRTGKSKERSA